MYRFWGHPVYRGPIAIGKSVASLDGADDCSKFVNIMSSHVDARDLCSAHSRHAITHTSPPPGRCMEIEYLFQRSIEHFTAP